MKRTNPIGALVPVCLITPGRSVPRPKVLSRPSHLIRAGLLSLILFGVTNVGLAQAPQVKLKSASQQPNARLLVEDDRPSGGHKTDDASVIKRSVLFPVRLGKRALSALGLLAENEHSKNPLQPVAEISQPEVTTAVVPTYPFVALHTHTIGEVVLEVNINSEGEVINVDPVSGAPILIGGSKSVARLWRFAPSTDKTSVRRARLTFVYRLVPKNTPLDRIQPIFKPPYRMEIPRAMPDDSPVP